MALPVSIKSGGAAAASDGQYRKGGRCRNENWAVIKEEALLQRELVSIKGGALPQREMGSIKSGGAAAARNGQYKKRGRCCNEKWVVKKRGRCGTGIRAV